MLDHPGDLLVVEDQAALPRIVDPADQVEDGGLAGAVGPDDREDLPGLHVEADGVQRPDAAEVDGEAVGLEECHRSRSDRMYDFCRRKVARL